MVKPATTPLRRFGHYLLLQQIDVTGVAEVHAAYALDSATDERLCELKVLRRELSGRKKSTDVFLDEGLVLSRLAHPGIVRLRDQGIIGGRNYLALEYQPGETIASLARLAARCRAYLPLTVALAICAQIARALEHAHLALDRSGRPTPIVHGAIEPASVRLSYQGEVKLLGFGNALTTTRLSETTGGEPATLPRYEAPEQLLEHKVTPATDIYRLGVMLYRLTVGRDPYAAESRRRFGQAVIDGDVVPPSAAVANFPPALDPIVRQAIARQPKQRFASAGELAAALERAVGLPPRNSAALLARWVELVAAERRVRHDALLRDLRAGRSSGLSTASFASWRSEEEPAVLPVELATARPTPTAHASRVAPPPAADDAELAEFGDLPTRPLSAVEMKAISDRSGGRSRQRAAAAAQPNEFGAIGHGDVTTDAEPMVPPANDKFEDTTTHPMPPTARRSTAYDADAFDDPTARLRRGRK